MADLFIGLISGTSMDGIDAALVEFSKRGFQLLGQRSHDIPDELRQNIFRLAHNDRPDLNLLGETDAQLGEVFADAAVTLIKQAGLSPEAIRAIGSHGQTIWHNPDCAFPFSLQIGDANRIVYKTGITTVADFRRRNMAAGGEGAPLAPAFHQAVFTDTRENRAIVNIGGIANVTYLPSRDNKNKKCFGFDCGPGNVLMDHWINLHRKQRFDKNGDWAKSGRTTDELLKRLMQDEYLQRPPPKSTGREHYHMHWLNRQLQGFEDLPTDAVQASLCEFTALSISRAITDFLPAIDRIMVCGGGAHNKYLMERLQRHQDTIPVDSTETHGLHPDWVEAAAFAWLAKQALEGRKTDLANITGARENQVLGAIYPADRQ